MLPFQIAPTTADEKTTLQGMLEMQRSILLWKLDGVSETDARRPLVSSGTSLLGVVKHMAWVEQWWFVEFIGGGAPDYPRSDEDPDADFRIEEGETIAGISESSTRSRCPKPMWSSPTPRASMSPDRCPTLSRTVGSARSAGSSFT